MYAKETSFAILLKETTRVQKHFGFKRGLGIKWKRLFIILV